MARREVRCQRVVVHRSTRAATPEIHAQAVTWTQGCGSQHASLSLVEPLPRAGVSVAVSEPNEHEPDAQVSLSEVQPHAHVGVVHQQGMAVA